jgi:hypothetical protein
MVDWGGFAVAGGRRTGLRAWWAALAIAMWACASPAVAAGLHPVPPPALPPPELAQSKDLWATVDICNTASHPHILGLRASIPGTGHRKQRLAIRFRAQFQQPDGQWTDLPGADSGFHDVGSAIFRARQSGWSFDFLGTQGGTHSVLRGLVDFQWRRRKNGPARYQTQLTTTAGHPSGSQGDPPNFSADTCTMP